MVVKVFRVLFTINGGLRDNFNSHHAESLHDLFLKQILFRQHQPPTHGSAPAHPPHIASLLPIPELFKPVLGEILRRPEIEIRIEFVDDAFEPDHRKEPNQKGVQTDAEQDDHLQYLRVISWEKIRI